MAIEAYRGRQVTRQWALLRALESARYGMTVGAIIDCVGDRATKRTIYRDLEALKAAGFALLNDDGKWRLQRDGAGSWQIPVRPTEVLALLFTEQLAGPLEHTSVGQAMQAIRARLRAMLTPQGRAYVQQIQQVSFATFFAPGTYAERKVEIDTIEEAIHQEQVLSLTYQKPGAKPRQRDVEPYATWFHNGRLYLIAWCRAKEDLRTFNVQRVVSAQMLDETFEPDPEFDPAAYARKGFGVYQDAAVHRIAVAFDAQVSHLARERTYHHTQRLRENPDGGVLLTMEAAGLPEVASWVASFGGKARPVRPPELVERVRAIHVAGLEALDR